MKTWLLIFLLPFCVVAQVAYSPFYYQPAPPNPLNPTKVWLKMTETSGNFSDATGNGNTGVVVGSPTYANPGVTLNGSSQYVTVTQNSGVPIYSPTAPYSISLWFTTTSSGTEQIIYSELGSGGNNNARFFLDFNNSGNSGKLTIYLPSSASPTSIKSSVAITASTQYNVIWTDNAGSVALYINGVKDASLSANSYTPGAYAAPGGVGIGVAYDGASGDNFSYFTGTIIDFRGYNSAISQSLVTSIYGAGPQ